MSVHQAIDFQEFGQYLRKRSRRRLMPCTGVRGYAPGLQRRGVVDASRGARRGAGQGGRLEAGGVGGGANHPPRPGSALCGRFFHRTMQPAIVRRPSAAMTMATTPWYCP